MQFFTLGRTIIESMLKKPATLMYPINKREPFSGTRGHISIEIGKCIYCSLCARKCPTGALVVAKPERKWEINRLKCITCSACVDVCPKKCLSMGQSYSPAQTGSSVDTFIGPAPAVAPTPAAPVPQA
jgi:formate hydrogenlyase subunit 6/NADH:ubiquinone oxidoreductase subunit I